MDTNELVNIYIEDLVNEVSELTKTKILLNSKLKFQELLNNRLQNRIRELEVELEVKSVDKNTF
jgi:hypothetical protein